VNAVDGSVVLITKSLHTLKATTDEATKTRRRFEAHKMDKNKPTVF